ncbi:hypothetical protein FACS1894104_1280 [Actinomycetota bacterium]|nr:hypothetical protein FACS1894104_1280 [Actinomycetota bacterium]
MSGQATDSLIAVEHRVKPSLLSWLAIFGFAFFFALEALLLFLVGVFPGLFHAQITDCLAIQSLNFAAYLCTGVLIAHNSYQILKHLKRFTCLGAIAAICSVALLALSYIFQLDSLIIIAIAYFLLGASFAIFHVSFLTFYTPIVTASTEHQIALSFLLGSVIAVTIAVFVVDYLILLILSLLLIAVATVISTICLMSMSVSSIKWIEASRQYSAFLTSNSVDIGIQGFLMGFAIIQIILLEPRAVFLAILSLALGSLATVFSAVFFKSKSYDAGKSIRLAIPLLFALFISMTLTSVPFKLICCCMIITISIYVKLSRASIGVITNNRQHLNPITHYSYVPMPFWFGAMLGFLSVLLISVYADLSVAQSFIVAVLLTTALTSASVIFRRITTIRSIKKSPVNIERLEEQQADERQIPGKDVQVHNFRKRLQKMSSEAGLTNKEFEIFRYLARGHNARHISNKLFVSVSTVKTHTSHIYNKFGVSSHQELLDIIDQR